MVKVKIIPPAPQTVFFQEHQFDEDLGGADPVQYLHNSKPEPKRKHHPAFGERVRKARLKKAKQALEGHENKEAILKILRGGK